MSSNIKIIILQKNLELLLIHRNSRDIEDFMMSPEKKPSGGKGIVWKNSKLKKGNPLSYFP